MLASCQLSVCSIGTHLKVSIVRIDVFNWLVGTFESFVIHKFGKIGIFVQLLFMKKMGRNINLILSNHLHGHYSSFNSFHRSHNNDWNELSIAKTCIALFASSVN